MGPDPRKRIPSLGQPVPAQPEDPWASLNDKWGVNRTEFQQQVANAPPEAAAIARQGLNRLAPTTAPLASPVALDQMGPNVPSFNNNSVPDFTTARGGYVGARTDAEAQRNLQSRFAQDQASDYMVGRYNKAIEALRGGSSQPQAYQPQTASAPELPGIWDRPGDAFGDAGMRQAKFEGMLSDAANAKGFGSKRRSAALLGAAGTMLQPGIENLKAETDLQGQQVAAQTEQAKSLSDLYQRNMLTPYQQAQLGLQQQQLDATQGLRKQDIITKGLDNIQNNLYGSQEFKNYVTTQAMMGTVRDLAGQDTPTAGTALATAVAKSRDPSTGVLQGEVEAIKQGAGNIPQRIGGWVNANILGGSPFMPSVRQDMVNATQLQTDNYRDQAMAKIDSLIPELQQRGISLDSVVNEKDLATYQDWKKRQGAQQQGPAAYIWDGEKLIPAQ